MERRTATTPRLDAAMGIVFVTLVTAAQLLRGQPPKAEGSAAAVGALLIAAGAKPLFVCRQTGTSLEMIEKHYGDARVDAEQLDEMIGELEPPTRNLSGTLPDADDDPLPSKVKEPLVFYGVPMRAGDRGRTGLDFGNFTVGLHFRVRPAKSASAAR